MITKKALVAPLDWGLGHAARCVPVISELQSQLYEPIIATSGKALDFLRLEFPELKCFELEPYAVQYAAKGSLGFHLMLQLPRLLKVVRKEHDQVENLVLSENVNAVISDNRYGAWSDRVPSVFLSHQLNLKLPGGFGWAAGLVNRKHRAFIKKFSACWVPDSNDQESLSGELSGNSMLNVSYLGNLSRFSDWNPGAESKYKIVCLLSGPEPHRTELEGILRSQFKEYKLPALFISGRPDLGISIQREGDLSVATHLTSSQLGDVLSGAELVISRPGYSTVMDLAALGKRAVFIPTPGQTEQEYIGKYLMEKRIALSVTQKDFDLKSALSKSIVYSGFKVKHNGDHLSKAIKGLLCDC